MSNKWDYLKELGFNEEILNLPDNVIRAYVCYKGYCEGYPEKYKKIDKREWDEHYQDLKDFPDFKKLIDEIGLESYKKQFLLAVHEWPADSHYSIFIWIKEGTYAAIDTVPTDIDISYL